jgi:hypothetical protein
MPSLPLEQLSAAERALADTGRYVELAERLSDRPGLAAIVLERVWDFAAAAAAYATAGAWVDALRVSIEATRPDLIDAALDALGERGDDEELTAAIAFLESRRKHAEAARLHRARDDGAGTAKALDRAGDRLGAAREHLERGDPRAALLALGTLSEVRGAAPRFLMAARSAWELGDLEAVARHGQAALRTLDDSGAADVESEVRALLARALESLGHPTAAEIVLSSGTADHARHQALGEQTEGRYRVLAHRHTPLPGAAYLALDRVTHEEVEVLLLLPEPEPEPEIRAAVRAFIERADAAATIDHPALRPILRTDAEQGLVVLARAEGHDLRTLIRPPGLGAARARAMALFLLDGLSELHRRGVVHGGVLPHLITLDVAGRPRLGPAGADALSRLAATRTDGLDDLLTLTPPELLRGAPATAAGDIYSLGRTLVGLLVGRLDVDPSALDLLEDSARDTLVAMLSDDPAARPSAPLARDRMSARVSDYRELDRPSATGEVDGLIHPGGRAPSEGARSSDTDAITAHPPSEFSDADIDALCEAADPWVQPILGRTGRLLRIAPWPEGTMRDVGGDSEGPKLDPRALASLPEPLQATLRRRGRAALVRTPAGEWMISLERLFADGERDVP